MVVGLIMGWMCRIVAFGADSGLGVIGCFTMGCNLAFSFSIPSAVKAFYFKNGNKFGIFYFVAEFLLLIGSIICLCLYWANKNKLSISICSITFGLNCPQKVIDKFNKYRKNLSNEGFNIELKTLEYDGVKLKTKERG